MGYTRMNDRSKVEGIVLMSDESRDALNQW